jgi:S1-C subfamily serine protease
MDEHEPTRELPPRTQPTDTAEPSGRRRSGTLVRRFAPVAAAGIIGAGAAVGIGFGAGLGGDGGTTTIVEAAPSAQTAPARAEAADDPQLAADGDNLSVQEIYRRAGPGVVQIIADAPPLDGGFSPFGPQGRMALGSGFVIDRTGHIVTNYHVIEGADEVAVNFSSGDERVPATVVGVDPSTDLAVLKVDVSGSALTPLPLGDSDEVEVGDPVVAIGNPFGLERTVTAGIVSALQREIVAPNGFPIDHAIQTDAAINHGNSGGPLLNAQGEVIGVNSQIQSGGVDGNVGVGFAVPVNTVRQITSQLIETGEVERAFLGIEMQTITPELAESFRLPVERGVLIAAVRPESPAEDAGLRGGDTQAMVNGQSLTLGGDVIVEVDGQAIEDADQLRQIVLAKRPGDSIDLTVNRDGESVSFTIELGRQPDTPTG